MLPHRAAAALAVSALLTVPALAQSPPGPPWPEVVSPGGITLRWYPDDVSEATAQAVADMHCAAIGRTAVLAELEQDGSVQLGTYRCR
ncbi:MAG TPA: hypothetical protein VME41_03095 [Stellaceae bacterium]|nr:hypothetical protein [Stellaceae bacterium]